MTFIPNIPTGSGNSQPDETRRAFGVVSVSGQSDVVADRDGDALTLVAGSNVTLTTDAATDSVTIASSGGGVSDGDKGDVTVSASGATWTIDNDVVTYAKMQNVSATSRVLGRKTGGAGDTEECTLSEVLDFIGSAAQGDVLYRGAANWTRLPAGTPGDVLTTGGAGVDPEWATAVGGGGAPANAQYVTLATNVTLSDERVLTAGAGITLTDGGAGGNLTVKAPRSVTFTIDGGGDVITTGIKTVVGPIPYSGTITKVTALSADASTTSGSIVIDLWSDTYGNYPPTDADSITAAAPVTISGAIKSQDSTLTGWTTSVTAGAIWRPNVDSVTSLIRVVVTVEIT